MEEARKHLQDVEYHGDPYEASRGADAVIIMTEWNEYRALDLAKLKESVAGDVFIDLKNVYDPKTVGDYGFRYLGVGRS
jgi:UDPglucose 6-dehydrogenase